ncbi:MAG: metallophosphoesterase [Oscillospiraceae bacterium]|nr:metallophosphoesterase [Oscillospiraceae bacterium]
MSHIPLAKNRVVQKRWLFLPLAVVVFALLAMAALTIRNWLLLVWPGMPRLLYWPVYVVLPLSIGISYLIPRSTLSRILHGVGETYLGFFIYLNTTVIALQIGHLILWLTGTTFGRRGHLIAGFIVLAVTAGVYIYGVVNAFFLRETHYEFTVEKPRERDVRIALISDLHFGFTTGRRMMRRIARKVNRLDADLVLIAGDLFDEAYTNLRHKERVAEDLRSLRSRHGVYACIGNHDLLSKDPRKDEFCRRAGVTILRDEAVQADGIWVAGRLDATLRDRLTAEELLRDRQGPVVVLDHQPDDIRSLAEGGADLILCGHTHAGQTFPGNYMVHFMHELSYGCRQYGKAHAVVTSGAGFWGPPLRVLSFNEVVCIDLKFNG